MLEREGYLERGAAQSRALRLTPTGRPPTWAFGRAHASVLRAGCARPAYRRRDRRGGPIEAYQDASESMAVPDLLAPSGDAYVLRVRGDSMINAHIQDGDFVLIRPQQTARDGDIVVAQVEENSVTLKQFSRKPDASACSRPTRTTRPCSTTTSESRES